MPEIKFPSDWLKINENVNDGDNIRFLDVGELDPETERFTFNVSIIRAGVPTEIKKFNLNKTNFKAIASAYGTNSDGWIGKEMKVNKITVRNPQTGTMVASIALSVPEIPAGTPAAVTPPTPPA